MRARMSQADRAKQFLPFAALKGYEEALRAKEEVVVPRPLISDDEAEMLDRRLSALKVNDMVSIVFYDKGKCLSLSSVLTRIDFEARLLRVVRTNVDISSILDIRGSDSAF